MADDTYSRGYRNDPYDRGGASDSGPATDPLTELARLIGQSDPFSPDRNRQRDPRQADAYPQQSSDWQADPAQHAQHYDPQHYDPQQYDHGAQDQRYGAAEPQQYADNTHGSGDQYASQQNGYAYPQAGQHGEGYADTSGYAEQPYHQDQQAYHQEQPAYQHDPHGYQDPQGYQAQQGYSDQPAYAQQAHHEPQAYHPDQNPYYQDQPAQPPEHPPAQVAYASIAPEQGEHAAMSAEHQPVPGYPAPPFFGTDPNARPDEYYEDAPAPRRGWLVTAAALIGLTVVGVAGAFAYRAVFTGGETRIISRDVLPNKITPAQAGQDSANRSGDRLASANKNEKLGPAPEQPMTIPEPPRTVPPAITQTQTAAAPPAPTPVLPPAPSAPSQASLPSDTGGNAAPRRVRTEKINPQQVGDVSGPRAGGPIRNVGPTPSIQPAQPRVVGPTPSANAPLSLAPNAPDPAPAPAPEPRVHTTAVAPPPPAVERSSGGGSGYYVQLSAQKSEEEAKSSFRGIQARHSGLLGGQHVVVRRKDLGSKGVFYGAQVGPFSREAAGKLCEGLKAAGQGCMIQRN
jgi:hypothetical protein